MPRRGAALLAAAAAAATAAAWDPAIEAYRAQLIAFTKDDVKGWATKTRAAREWMAANDPDYPLYHLTAPEGWNNDPNGVTFDPKSGLYHRFYQYDKTYGDACMHGNTRNCSLGPSGAAVPNAAARTWGQTVSRDGAFWEDWPGVDADKSGVDDVGVFSGNCAINDDGSPVCIYSNGRCDIGVCAYSTDWVHWSKTACMTKAPSARSQTNHDSSIWRDGPGGTWYMLSGGCTYNGTNNASLGVPCEGNAQLWNSSDLKTFTYMQPITPGGPGPYWELPYLLPFDEHGEAIDNCQRSTRCRLATLLTASLCVHGSDLSPCMLSQTIIKTPRRTRCSSGTAMPTTSATTTRTPRNSRRWASRQPRPACSIWTRDGD